MIAAEAHATRHRQSHIVANVKRVTTIYSKSVLSHASKTVRIQTYYSNILPMFCCELRGISSTVMLCLDRGGIGGKIKTTEWIKKKLPTHIRFPPFPSSNQYIDP